MLPLIRRSFMLSLRSFRLPHVAGPIQRRLASTHPRNVSANLTKPAKPQLTSNTTSSKTRLPPPPSSPQDPISTTPFRYRHVRWVFAAFAVYFGFYGVQIYRAASKPCLNPSISELSQQKDVAARYDYTAANFDSEVGWSEILMGINGIRKKLARQCKGHVLEVSCGTGRNLGYYNVVGQGGKVDSLSLIDLSPQMVEVCKKKWTALFGNDGARLKPGLKVRFMTGSALESMPLAPSGRKYDTIIQTMGLCSTPDPAALLKNMVKHLDTEKEGSRIFLLEHGRSYLPWLNNVIDNAAEKHAEIHGCWFNRDVGHLVEEVAKQSGLEVVKERRYHLGTTWVFELKPAAKAGKNTSASPLPPKKVDEPEKQKSVLSGWVGRG